MNKKEYIEERTLALEKALVFHINNQIKKHFKSKEEYVKYYNNNTNKQFNKKLNNAFSIPSTIIRLICGDVIKFDNGERCRVVNDIKTNLLNRGNIIILKHFHEHYLDSKKDYTTVDRYLINPDKIDEVLFDDAKISDINSGYYTDLESQLIFKYVMNPDPYLKNFKNMKKRVKKNTQIETKEQTTKYELEMKTIEEEINNTKTETTMTTKPDTQILDMLNMMNEKINSLIKANVELKKELDEIKSSIQNNTVTKVEEKKEDTTSNVEDVDNTDDDINEDNTDKTVPKDLIKDRWGFKYDLCNAKFPFNGYDRNIFREKLSKAHSLKKISYFDYMNFLTIIGVKDLPTFSDEQKSTSREAKYYNYFYNEYVKRGYNMFGMYRMKEDNTTTNTGNKSITQNENIAAFNKILNEELNHKYDDECVNFGKMLMNKDC